MIKLLMSYSHISMKAQQMPRKVKPRHIAKKEEKSRAIPKPKRFNQQSTDGHNNFMYPLNVDKDVLDQLPELLQFMVTSVRRVITETATTSTISIEVNLDHLSCSSLFQSWLDSCTSVMANNSVSTDIRQCFKYEDTVYSVTRIHVDSIENSMGRAITLEGMAIPDLLKIKRII